MSRLIPTLLLDPRDAAVADARPMLASVNIPVAEIASRTFELPPRTIETVIAEVGADTHKAVAELATMHRPSRTTDDFQFSSDAQAERYRLWCPNAWLEATAPQLPPGRALDLACGSGRDSVYLASLGWDVLGVDVLPDALDQARSLANRYTPDSHVRFERLDLESGSVSFEERFDLIVGFRYLHRPLFPRLVNWTMPHGRVIYETFTTLHRDRHGKPSRDAHLLRPGELRDLLRGWTIEQYDEGWKSDCHTARVVARRADA